MQVNGEEIFASTICSFSSNNLEESYYLSSIERSPVNLITVGLLAHSSSEAREAFHFNRTTGVSLKFESEKIKVDQLLIPAQREDAKDFLFAEFELLIGREAFTNWKCRFGQSFIPVRSVNRLDKPFAGWAQISQDTIRFLTLINEFDSIDELTSFSVFRGPMLADRVQVIRLH